MLSDRINIAMILILNMVNITKCKKEEEKLIDYL